jgi:CheY-like chemotaxis protein
MRALLGFVGKTGGTALAPALHTAMFSILFVSHDRDLRAVASRVLRKSGWEVTAVAHGGHALLECVAGRRFDVVVVEDQMSDGSGVLARQLRRYCADIQTVYIRDQYAARVGHGISVTRPFTAPDLIEAVLEAAAATAIASA